ncbi:tyrosine-type recombinase/integrase [Bradyrhizobium liaoningense]|uniref:tyrosine-type recombinase/integrase n=1 Tax=Bradyrhizobium liaoningense TaxID=43992 RepID=UPI001BA504B2|nr:tyrosine-type recombinase/integrase [Bradyrhizobium liaoningense]MBR0986115.1 site-specific integrase [Bradyrhizobium liaoningense]
MKTHPLPIYLQRFFTERLATQLSASPNTVTSYRDAFRLLLKFAADRLGRSPTELQLIDIDADLVGQFLTEIENARGNSARSRNTRLSAIRSFFRYVSVNEPQLLHHCQRILAMPAKRHEKRAVDYLSRAEIASLIEAPDLSTWHGRRDRTLLALALQTGLRVSELIGLSCGDIVLGTGAHVRCVGKGRKQRSTPIRKDSVKVLRDWLAERGGAETDPLFVSNRNQRLSRDAVEQIVRKHVKAASANCPSLKKKRVTPHVLRHSAAMQLLQNGVDRTVIALWLGHESVETTQMYIHADIQLKERAMARTHPVKAAPGRYRPDDKLLAFLEAL